MENSTDTSSIISDVIRQMNEKVASQVDQQWIKENLAPVFERLDKKKREGTLDLVDFRDLLRIYKNVLIPEAKKQVIQQLHSVEKLAKVHKDGSVGIR